MIIDPDEYLYCCLDIDTETTWKYKWVNLMVRHMSTARHVANMFCVPDQELIKRAREEIAGQKIMAVLQDKDWKYDF